MCRPEQCICAGVYNHTVIYINADRRESQAKEDKGEMGGKGELGVRLKREGRGRQEGGGQEGGKERGVGEVRKERQ